VILGNKVVAPYFMQRVAQMSLEKRLEYPPSSRPMTSTGIKRARQLANKKPLSMKDLIDMRAFLIRHEKNYKPNKRDSQGRYTKGTISYWAWGGVSGRRALRWVEDRLEEQGYFE
jgi:hypothetical protein